MLHLWLASFIAALALATQASAAAVRIMALGDSITGSPGCWRALLWRSLVDAGHTNIDFVGSLAGDGCGFTYDGEHDGHGGYLATNIASQNQLPGWLSIAKPDIVIMTLGTNDVWNNIPPANITAAFSVLVNQMRASNPNMKIGVAKILPMNPSGCTDCNARVIALDNAIPAWASSKSTSASPITVVDLYTGFNTATDTNDGVHPNDAGITKIAPKWYSYLYPLTGSGTTTGPTTTTRSTTTTTTTRSTSTSTRTTTSPTSSSTSGGCTTAKWGQCGGQGWSGCTTCAAGSTCVVSNSYYSQCL